MNKKEKMQEVFLYIKKEKAIEDFGGVNPRSGFNHRFSEQVVGGVRQQLTKDDYQIVCTMIDRMVTYLKEAKKILKQRN